MPLGINFDALFFYEHDVGFGVNKFYYLRHDALQFSTFGVIDPIAMNYTDVYPLGVNFNQISFTPDGVNGNTNLFYYLRGAPFTACTVCSNATCNSHGICAANNQTFLNSNSTTYNRTITANSTGNSPCACNIGYTGDFCDSCSSGYIGYPQCTLAVFAITTTGGHAVELQTLKSVLVAAVKNLTNHNQWWQFINGRIVSYSQPGYCFDVSGNSTITGAQVLAWTLKDEASGNTVTNQLWTIDTVAGTIKSPIGAYFVKAATPSLTIEMSYENPAYSFIFIPITP